MLTEDRRGLDSATKDRAIGDETKTKPFDFLPCFELFIVVFSQTEERDFL